MNDQQSFPRVSVVIPALHGNNESLNRLEEAVRSSGIPAKQLEVIAAVGIRPNGRARDAGAIRARGDVLIFMDADVSFPDPSDLRTIVEYLVDHDEVGLVGPAQQLPDSLSERKHNRAIQMARSHVEAPDQFKECDMVTHACLAIERELFLEIGMEHPNLISGTDPDLRNRVRRQGLKVGIVPDTRVEHPPETSTNSMIKKRFRMGRWSRWVKRHYPEYHLPTEPDITDETGAQKTGLTDRLGRNFSRLTQRLTNGDWWALTARLSYLAGYLFETIFKADWVEEIPYTPDPSGEPDTWTSFINALSKEGNVLFPKRADWSLPEENPFDEYWIEPNDADSAEATSDGNHPES